MEYIIDNHADDEEADEVAAEVLDVALHLGK